MVNTHENAIRLEAYFRSMELKFSSLLVCLEELKEMRKPFHYQEFPKSKFINCKILKYIYVKKKGYKRGRIKLRNIVITR